MQARSTRWRKRFLMYLPSSCSYSSLLPTEVVDQLQHLICGLHHARVRFVGTLRHDHLNELIDHADVGLLEIALLDLPQTVGAAWRTDHRVARGRGGEKEVFPDTVQAARIGKER